MLYTAYKKTHKTEVKMKQSIKIKSYYAGEIYGHKLGTRKYLSPKDAVLSDSLLSRWLKKHGMEVSKNETKDIICLDFKFGHNDYEGERVKLNRSIKRVEKDIRKVEEKHNKGIEEIENNPDLNDKQKEFRKGKLKKTKELRVLQLNDKKKAYEKAQEDIKKLNESNPDIFMKVSKNDMRVEFYTKKSDILDNKVKLDKIEYDMLYRSTSKAKTGKATFINSDLYKDTYEWMTMGLGNLADNKKIVEMSAYMGLVASSIIDDIKIKPSEILFLKDQESEYIADANIVKVKNGICVVEPDETTVSNVLWDGMSLIDNEFIEEHIKQTKDKVELNGMILLRNHFFKSCAFKTRIKDFMIDQFGEDYENKTLTDMFGKKKAKDIKLIVTDKSLKWLKFKELMGNTDLEAYKYWCDRLKKDGYIFGIVKTDHPSKLGEVQKMSAQMINSLELTRGQETEEIKTIAKQAIERVVNMELYQWYQQAASG
jgi:hypothetical protein